MAYFEYRHEVGMDEADQGGNVLSIHFLRWQRFCREDFLRQHASGEFGPATDVELLVTECGCQYLKDPHGLSPFDVVALRMRAAGLSANQLSLTFEYVLLSRPGEPLMATGWHRVACVRRQGDQACPAEIPPRLVQALERYGTVSPTVA